MRRENLAPEDHMDPQDPEEHQYVSLFKGSMKTKYIFSTQFVFKLIKLTQKYSIVTYLHSQGSRGDPGPIGSAGFSGPPVSSLPLRWFYSPLLY